MEVTIPEGVSGKHKLYAVVTSVGTTTDKYIANFKDLKGYYMYSNPDYVGDDAVVSLIASVVPGTYRELREIELYSKADGVKIYYTTDGSDPKTSATKVLYTEKIQLKGEAGKSVTTTIKAYAVNADLVESDVAEYVYVIELPENTFTGVAADENGSLHYYEMVRLLRSITEWHQMKTAEDTGLITEQWQEINRCMTLLAMAGTGLTLTERWQSIKMFMFLRATKTEKTVNGFAMIQRVRW